MSKHVSFPASHLSAFEVGKRVRVITKQGARIEDTITGLKIVTGENGIARIFVEFKSVGFHDNYGNGGTFEILPDQYVKRIEDSE